MAIWPWIYEASKTRLKTYYPVGTRVSPTSLYGLTEPVDANFSWFNQGTATVDTTSDGILLTPPKDSTDNLRGREINTPGTPYTITAAFALNGGIGSLNGGGMYWRQSSDNKCIFAHIRGAITGGSGDVDFNIYKLTNATTFSSSAFNKTPFGWLSLSLFWLRLNDDGTNRNVSISNNGIDFSDPVYTEGRTTYLTADRIGFAVNNISSAFTTKLRLLHWKQT